jgi:potassium efflux system protein
MSAAILILSRLRRWELPRLGLPAAIAWTLLATSLAVGQQTARNPPNEASSSNQDVAVVEDIDAALKLVDESNEIDDTIKTQVRELYAQARAKLDKAKQQQEAAARYQSWVATAGQDIEDANQQKDASIDVPDLDEAASRGLADLVKDQSALEQRVADAKTLLLDAQREPQRRLDRKSMIPDEIVAAQALIKEIDGNLQAVSTASDPPMVVRARTTLLQSRRQAQLALIAALESERDAYQAQGELPRLRVDLLTARIKQLGAHVRDLLAIITDKRRTDAVVQKEDAQTAWQAALPALQPYPQQAIDLADRRLQLASLIQSAAAHREQVGKNLKRWRKDFARVQEQAAEEDSDNVGIMLIEKRSSLPSRTQLKRERSSDQKGLRELRRELYQWEDRREDLSDIDAVVATELSKLSEADPIARGDAGPALAQLFSLEVRILDSLLKDANRNYSLRLEALTDQGELVGLIEQYHEFIEERIFGVRSAPVLGIADIEKASEAMAWLADANAWSKAGSAAAGRVRTAPLITLLFVGSFAFLMLATRPIRRRLQELGHLASSDACRAFWPTSWALVLTVLLAAPGPVLVWSIGWVLSDVSTDPGRLVSAACLRVAVVMFVLEWIRQLCQPSGLAASHFGWPSQACSVWYSQLRVLVFGGIPLVLLAIVFEYQRNPEYRASIGRLALVAFLLLSAFTAHRLFRAKSGVFTELVDGQLSRLRHVRHALVIFVPASLAVLAIVGFQFTAFELLVVFVRTLELFFILFVVGELLFRGVQIRRRRLRWQRTVDAQRLSDAEEAESGDPDALAAREEVVDLAAMDQQSRRLITVSLAVVGLFALSAIWVQFFPSLNPMLETELWTIADVGGGTSAITLSAVLLSILVVGLAIVAQRNITGLVNFLLVGRFGIESSTRYVISALSQYAIMFIAVLCACHLIGITWSKAQWLIAALSVGLGFGLQEVVANFVCGILLLFERPIRVGDVVTLGDTTGIVIQIRSRATTVRNWDRQEVVIPNKELITARITNWTLSDQLNRIVLQVGIAYGSDTRHARDLLMEVLRENPKVLEDPPPQVAFEQFGDSSLNFTVRAHLSNLDMAERLETTHQLNTSINERFAEEGIQIPFPQRDLHVRSVDASAKLADVTAERI